MAVKDASPAPSPGANAPQEQIAARPVAPSDRSRAVDVFGHPLHRGLGIHPEERKGQPLRSKNSSAGRSTSDAARSNVRDSKQ